MRTVYAMFDRYDQAERAMSEFVRAGLPADRVGLLAKKPGGNGMLVPFDVPGIGQLSANGAMRGMLAGSTTRRGGLPEALTRLGVPEREVGQCVDAIGRGAIFEAVVVDDNKEADVRAIMKRHTADTYEDIVVPVIREELRVGTRQVDAGGVRISSHVREVPVEQTITVREERVTVERRIIDRPIDETDDAFRDRTIDLRAKTEEPVVTKRAHVVEEIRIHKDRNERVQKVNDTLRHTDVQLHELAGERTFDATRYRDHYEKYYAGRYDLKTVAPAYEFGEMMARRGGGEFTRVEGDARAAWEQKNPGTWDKVRDAILAGWQRIRH